MTTHDKTKAATRGTCRLHSIVRFSIGMVLAFLLDIPLRIADACDTYAKWVYKYYGSDPLTRQLWSRRPWRTNKPNKEITSKRRTS